MGRAANRKWRSRAFGYGIAPNVLEALRILRLFGTHRKFRRALSQ